MRSRPNPIILVLIFFTLVTALFFYPVFTKHTVPLPLNLLVSFYSPWRNEGYKLPNKPIGFDNVRQMLPYKMFTKESLTHGSLPLWNPYLFAGSPHIAMLQPAFFYPGTLLDLLLPLTQSWTFLVLMQPIIAGVLMYVFLRALHLSPRASLVGAVSYAYCGWMIAWWEEFLIVVHSIIWLPLALYGVLLIWQNRKRYGFFIVTIAFTLSMLAGFTQSTIYLALSIAAWSIALWARGKDTKNLYIVGSALLISLLLTAVQWIPTLETYLLSPRSVDDASYIFSAHLLPLTHLVTLFAPDFWGNPGTYNAFGNPGFYQERIIYLGLVPLFLALIALIHVKKQELTFWKYFTVITYSMVFAIPTSWIWYTLHIPIISAMQPTRIMMVTSLGASILAAYGFEILAQKKNLRILTIPTFCIGVIALSAWAWVARAYILSHRCPIVPDILLRFCLKPNSTALNDLLPYSSITLRNLIVPTATLVLLLAALYIFHRRTKVLWILLIALHLTTMGYFAQKYLYFSPASNLYPPSAVITAVQDRIGTSRAWAYGNATIENNMLSYFHIASPEGYTPFFPKQFGELMGAIGKKGGINSAIGRSDVTLKIADETETMDSNPYRLRLMSLLGVRYIMESKNGEHKDLYTPVQRFPPSLFTLAWENKDWRLWNYTNALPRTFIATKTQVLHTDTEFGAFLFDHNTDLLKTIAVREPIDMQGADPAATGTATITSYLPNTVVIQTKQSSPGVLFLSDSYYPGWYAYVDGVQTKIYEADYAFRAVALPKGNHIVEFRYEPVSWKIGIMVSILGIISCTFLAVRKKKINY